MKRVLSLPLFGLVMGMAAAGFAGVDSEAGTAASNILTLQKGARPAAMGGAYTAVSNDINAVYHNPAGLGFFKVSEFGATQTGGYADFKLTDLALAIPLGDVTARNVRSLGTIALDYANLDYGTADAFTSGGTPIGSMKAKDQVYGLGWGKALNDRVAIGALARLYELEIFGEKANGTSINVGGIFKLIPDYLHIGMAGTNIGSKIQYAGKSEDAPTEYTAGVSFMPLADRVVLALDAGKAEDRSSVVRLGGEFNVTSSFCLRAGYDSSYDAGTGLSFGAGIQILDLEFGFFPVDRLGLDYAFLPGDQADGMHRVALTARIGTY